jgi:hypothetical protein
MVHVVNNPLAWPGEFMALSRVNVLHMFVDVQYNKNNWKVMQELIVSVEKVVPTNNHITLKSR